MAEPTNANTGMDFASHSDLSLANAIDNTRPMSDPNNSRVADPEPIAPTLGGNATADMNPVSGLGGAGAQPKAPTLASRVAGHITTALGMTEGHPGDWARATIAGALAGLGAASRAPVKRGAGFGAGIGIGGEAGLNLRQQQMQHAEQLKQQDTENAQKQQQLDLAKQREQRESGAQSQEMTIRQHEDARQQAQSIRDAALFEKRVSAMDQDLSKGNFENMKLNAEYLDGQADRFNALQKVGAKPLQVAGADVPEFDHLGDAEKFAMENSDAVINGYKSQLVRNPSTGKYKIMEVPKGDDPEWRDIKGADGKSHRVFTDAQGYLAQQEEVAKTKHLLLTANKSSLELKKELEEFKEEGSVKGARKELTKVGGDYGKLTPGSREALIGDANKRFMLAQAGLEKELQKPEELRDTATVDMLTRVRKQYADEVQTLMQAHPNNVNGVQAPGAANQPAASAVVPDHVKSIVTLNIKNVPPEQQYGWIMGSKVLSDGEKQSLIKELGLKPPQATPEEVSPTGM